MKLMKLVGLNFLIPTYRTYRPLECSGDHVVLTSTEVDWWHETPELSRWPLHFKMKILKKCREFSTWPSRRLLTPHFPITCFHPLMPAYTP